MRTEPVAAILERGWCQGVYARDSRGHEVAPSDPSATSWCLRGAIVKAYGETTDASVNYRMMLLDLCDDFKRCSITTWNDTPSRTKAEVVALAKRADEEYNRIAIASNNEEERG